MLQRLFRWLDLIGPRDKLVKVRSWAPYWDGKELTWPTMLIDQYGYRRCGISPVWDRVRLRQLFQRRSNDG